MERQFEKRDKRETRGAKLKDIAVCGAQTRDTGEYERERSARLGSDVSCRSEVWTGGDLIDSFDPNDRESNVDRKLAKIDKLGEIHGRTE